MRKRAPDLARVVAATLLALAPAPASASPTYYVSLGDSWAQGVLRVHGTDQPTDRGFSDVLYRKLRRTHPGLRLVKLGCRAATTATMIHGQKRCGVRGLPYGGANSQLDYARRFLRTHRGEVAYVTVIIGGNEVWSCGCAGHIRENLPTIAHALRRAAGPDTPILGSTYANILVARGDSNSTKLFEDTINPTMKRAYAAADIGFADVTSAFGGRDAICTLAYVCAHPEDVHLNARGYAKLARLIYQRLPSKP